MNASYVVQHQEAGFFSAAKNAVCKVPSNDMEALKSSLMTLFEKKRVVGLYKFINDCKFDDSKTWQGLDIAKCPMSDVFTKFGI